MNDLISKHPNIFMIDLVVDDKTALATPNQFERLMEYSTTLPTGKYHGKRWKRAVYGQPNLYEVVGWMLGEYYETPEMNETNEIGIRWRELIVVK